MDLDRLMTIEEQREAGCTSLTPQQKEALVAWGLKMYQIGQHVVGNIEDVKYDGRLVILDDGSRWEVDSLDSSTAEMWGFLDKVVVIDDEMYKLDESERVSVTQEH